MFVNNVTCLQQQQPLAIHYDRDDSHSILRKISGIVGGATRKTFPICTGYNSLSIIAIAIVWPYALVLETI